MGGAPHPPQGLRSRVEVLRLLGVGDEHCRPPLEGEVGEAEEVVVKGHHSVSERGHQGTVTMPACPLYVCVCV